MRDDRELDMVVLGAIIYVSPPNTSKKKATSAQQAQSRAERVAVAQACRTGVAGGEAEPNSSQAGPAPSPPGWARARSLAGWRQGRLVEEAWEKLRPIKEGLRLLRGEQPHAYLSISTGSHIIDHAHGKYIVGT